MIEKTIVLNDLTSHVRLDKIQMLKEKKARMVSLQKKEEKQSTIVLSPATGGQQQRDLFAAIANSNLPSCVSIIKKL